MRSEVEIRKLLALMEQTYQDRKLSILNETFMPSDAFESAETLKWVLGEGDLFERHFEHNGLNMEEWLREAP